MKVVRVLFASLFALAATALAQPEQGSVASLRELLAGGYYALAAQVDGPQVVRAHPENAEAHVLYARALYLVGDLEAATTQLGRVRTLEMTPELRQDFRHLEALLRAAQGNAEGALRLLRQLFRDAPEYEIAMDWGLVAWQSGNLEAALRAYREAAQTERGRREPWPSLNEVRLLLLQGKPAAAIRRLETTLTILEADPSPRPSPAYAEAFYRLGEAYEALGETAEAVSNYQAAQSINPEYLPATEALGRLENR